MSTSIAVDTVTCAATESPAMRTIWIVTKRGTEQGLYRWFANESANVGEPWAMADRAKLSRFIRVVRGRAQCVKDRDRLPCLQPR
jgi:hypothetical protein